MTAIALQCHTLLQKWRTLSNSFWQSRFACATDESASRGNEASTMHFAVLGGMAVVEVGLASFVVFSPSLQSAPAKPALVGCQPYVELRSAAGYAREPGGPDTINLWSSLSIDRWKTGELLPGGRAVILGQNGDGYKVVTSDGTEGWVSNFQVSRTLRQDTASQRACD